MQRGNIVQTLRFDKEFSKETNNEFDLKLTDYYYY